MYHWPIIFLNLLLATTLAYATEQTSLGDEARMIQASGKKHHGSESLIRKMHPEFLLHKRDRTSREGVRTKKHSLKNCVYCHANKDKKTNQYYSVNKSGQFCSVCHQKVSVSIDCFACHRNTPSKGANNAQ